MFSTLFKNKISLKFGFVLFRIKGELNKINSEIRMRYCKINVIGDGNSIEVKGNGKIKNMKVVCHGDNNKITIVAPRDINTLELIVKDNNSSIFIDKGCGIGSAKLVSCGGASIIIGKDCMFADRVTIWACDTHSILDKYDGYRVNKAEDVTIGEHVWLAEGVCVLKASRVGDNTVVGAYSVVPGGVYQNNSIIAGNPAREVKSNINWCIERL
ncbi:hypothetical protein AB6E76_007505 [Vibrio cyclitrophicus]